MDSSGGGPGGGDFELFAPQLIWACTADLEDYARQQAGIDAVVLASADGLPLASATYDSQLASRMSAVTSSLFALGEVTCREGRIGDCSHVTVEGSAGRLLAFAIPLAPDWLVLSISAKKDALFGTLLWSGNQLANQLRERFESERSVARG